MTTSATPDKTLRTLEAILFASPEPLSTTQLRERMGASTDIDELLQDLQKNCADRGVNLIEIDGVWSFRTAADLASELKIIAQPRRKLPRVAAETLAIIAYHQPVTRGEIEAIRGVAVNSETLAMLLELGWIRPAGRRETPGKPITWGTAPDFLSHFNLKTLDDLPGLDDLRAAGLLDARPVLDTLPVSADDTTLDDTGNVMDTQDDHSDTPAKAG